MALADIQREIQAIQTAYNGEDVRGSLVSALTAMNNNTNGICEQAAADAQTAASDAQSSAITASTSATQAATSASTATSAASSASADAARAEAAAGQAVQGGVRSFNGRNPAAQTGNIAPEAGDYTSDMIYHNDSGTKTVKSELDVLDDWVLNGMAAVTASVGTKSIAANGLIDISISATRTGKWQAIGCVGFSNNKNPVFQWKCIITATTTASDESGTSTATISIGYTNTSNAAVSIQPGVRVLWVKVP